MSKKTLCKAFVLLLFLTGVASAEPVSKKDLDALQNKLNSLTKSVSELQSVIKEQQKTIDDLKNRPIADTAPVVPNSKAAVSSNYLPEIGAVGDFVGTSTESKEDEDGNDRISARELELVIGHDIDPYSRFDSTISFSDQEDASLEEAYVSYWGLPYEINGRIGRFKPKIGKALAVHRDSLDTVDEPLVIQRYFGKEGLSKSGIEFSGFTPLSEDTYTQQLTAGFIEGGVGDEGELLGETERRPTFYSRLSNFWEISDVSNFEIGGNYLLGSSDEDSSYEVNAFSVDTTYSHFFTPINKFKFQNEFFFQDRKESGMENDNPLGFYSLVDYRLNERWGIGSRFDYVEPVNSVETSLGNNDKAGSAYLTFYQSEFARWRFQYQFADLADGSEDNRFFLQGTFAIGTHKHNIQ
jgi:hypothetical protein